VADHLLGTVGSRLGGLVDRRVVPSVAYAVVRDGRPTTGGFGGAEPESVFQIGSVTKAFTGLLLADLLERGQLELTDPAEKYLPGARSAKPKENGVTLLDLATHTAGLPHMPRGFTRYALLSPGDPYARYPAQRLLAAARRELGSATGGQPYQYSNFGFGILGHLLAQAAGADLPALIEERVCAPLGLSSTRYDATPIQGYRKKRKVPAWHAGPLPGAAGLNATAVDLGKLLTACLDPGSTPLKAAVETALRPRVTISAAKEIGLAWNHDLRDGQRVIWHNGMVGGFTAIVAFCPEKGTGAAAVANGGGNSDLPLDALVIDALFRED
jgi:D-alanyl-D-alanine-carboxypeptidase/D-alanyl-D-alanine-endopeptidase